MNGIKREGERGGGGREREEEGGVGNKETKGISFYE